MTTVNDDFSQVLRLAIQGFQLDINGAHGLPHWERVLAHGNRIADTDRFVDRRVVALFAILHDSQRVNEYTDPMHGPRAARWARELYNTGVLRIEDEQINLLEYACAHHSEGHVIYVPTIQACWDADRLDLGRVGVKPDPKRMGGAYARMPEVIEAAWIESQNWVRASMIEDVS